MNEDRTRSDGGSNLTQANHGSFPARYELIDKGGRVVCSSDSAQTLANEAKVIFPDQQQDEDRRGLGWDIQIAGAK